MKSKLLLSSAVAILFLAGCHPGVERAMRGRADVDDGYGVILSQQDDEELRKSTAFNQESVTRDPYGLMHVNIPLRSAVDRTQYLEYQYSFFDGTRTLIEGPMGWTRVTLEAGSPGTIQLTSTSPKAAEWRCVIRYQR